ncbi:hypothetical protein [Gordonia sputi]
MTMTLNRTADDLEHTQVDADEQRARRLTAKLRDDVRDLEYLAEVWPWLISLRVPGTRKRWAQHSQQRRHLSVDALDAMGWKGVPRPAAADVSVLDVIGGIDAVARRVADEALYVLPQYRIEVWRPSRAPSHDARPWLRLAARLLPQAHDVTVDDLDPIVEWTEARLGVLPADAARLMGDVRDGQDLAGICPWCNGLTDRGTGEPTLRIHYPRDVDLAKPFDPDAGLTRTNEPRDAGPVIVCHGVNCTPPSRDCGHHWHGHPAWNMREWEWLAKQLGTPEGKRA